MTASLSCSPGKSDFLQLQNPSQIRRSNSLQAVMHQFLEVVDAVLSFDRESPAIIGTRGQSLLHVDADFDIFLLDLVAERNDLLHALPAWTRAWLLEV